jgi:hypothetical protein
MLWPSRHLMMCLALLLICQAAYAQQTDLNAPTLAPASADRSKGM